MRSAMSWVLLWSLLLIGVAIDAHSGQQPLPPSQTSSTSISGEVVDEHGGLLPGVDLELRSASDPSFVRSAVTDGEGRFLFPMVPVGAYTLKATVPGFRTAVRDVSASPGQSAGIRLSLPIGREFGVPVSNPPPPSPAEERRNFARIPVFFATDRNQSTSQPLQFGITREPTNSLHLGRFVVSVPRDHRLGDTERPTLWSFYREDPDKHFVIVRRERLDYEKFYGELRSQVGKSAAKQVLVFIHGFNVAFEDAIYRTAQISYDIGFDGAPILYSWPSVARTLDYRIDERNNEWTVNHLRWFLEDVRTRAGADVVHLIAHSMGNRALAAALGQMEPSQAGAARFSQVIMTAPDIDNGVFPDLAARMKRIAGRITIYASEHDLALMAAHTYDTFPRVGSTKPDIVIIDGFDTIDASRVDTSLLGHSYVGDSAKVLSDIFYTIRGDAASGRAFIEGRGTPPRTYWAFK